MTVEEKDLRNADMFLAKIISETCEGLVEHTKGYPSHISEAVWTETLLTLSAEFGVYAKEGFGSSTEEFAPVLEMFAEAFPHLWY